jgi:DNA-binding transcriptional LysR family regulator
MRRLRVAFDAMPLSCWGPLFQVLCLEHPDLRLEWQSMGFPTADRDLLEGADVGLFIAPPEEPGFDALTIGTSQMVVLLAAGHRLAQYHELSVAQILDEPFPAGPNHHPGWRAFWTLDKQRGGPPRLAQKSVENLDEGTRLVASGAAIATAPASICGGLPHPGVVAVPLRDAPPVPTRLVWRSDDVRPIVHSLVDLAGDMTRDLGVHGAIP